MATGGSIATKHFIYAFDWPDFKAKYLSLWNSFCIVYDKNSSTLSLFINGKPASLRDSREPGQNETVVVKTALYTGLFIGQITDLYVWNTALTTKQIETYAIECSDHLFRVLEPLLVSWSKLNMTMIGQSPQNLTMERSDFCKSASGNINRIKGTVLKLKIFFGHNLS